MMQLITTWFVTLALALMQGAGAPPREGTQRFDYLVRADFFAGIAGDDARLQQAIDLCERALAENPGHAEVLVWHGAALVVRSGQAFARGDRPRGAELWGRGVKEMNDAVSIAPDSVGVLIPRSAVLLEATRNLPEASAKPLIELAVAGYERVLDIQAPYFATLGDHEKGELLFGLAEGYHRLGDYAKARGYFERLITDAPASGQAPRAREWMSTGTVPTSSGTRCAGCHK